MPRIFSNQVETRRKNGSKTENGCGHFADISATVLKQIAEMGVTSVWYTGVIRHATAERNTPSIVKGKAGSPYAITDYYDVDPDLAVDEAKRMSEFESLIRRTHKAGLKVIIDFVPNHVAREYKSLCKPKGVRDLGEDDHSEWAFSPLNNFYYLPGERFQPSFPCTGYEEYPAKVTGNDCFSSHPTENDWYETIKLNYGVHYLNGGEKQFNPRPNTWDKMLDILCYWSRKGVDAFRVDMAEMVPVEFFEWAISQVRTFFPHVQFYGECYQPELYHSYLNAGFDYLYDKVGMYEYLRGVTSKNWPVAGITEQWQKTNAIRDRLIYFLENHDEQRVASGFFAGTGRCAEPAMIVAATLGTNPILIYAGQELGEKGMDAEGFSGMDGKTSIFDYWGVRSLQAWCNHGKWDGKLLDENQKELRSFYQRLLVLARDNKAITEGKMYDLEYAQAEGFNSHEEYVYLRKADDELLLFVLNFHDRDIETTIRIPKEAFEYLDQEEWEKAFAIDLLTNKQLYSVGTKGKELKYVPFCSTKPLQMYVPAWTGMIIKLNKIESR